MKKHALFLLGLSALSLTACGEITPASSSVATSSPDEPVISSTSSEITYTETTIENIFKWQHPDGSHVKVSGQVTATRAVETSDNYWTVFIQDGDYGLRCGVFTGLDLITVGNSITFYGTIATLTESTGNVAYLSVFSESGKTEACSTEFTVNVKSSFSTLDEMGQSFGAMVRLELTNKGLHGESTYRLDVETSNGLTFVINCGYFSEDENFANLVAATSFTYEGPWSAYYTTSGGYYLLRALSISQFAY